MREKTGFERRILNRLVEDTSYRDKMNMHIDSCIDLIDSGHSGKSLEDQVSGGKQEREIILEVSKARINSRGRFSNWDRLWFDRFSSRYATPEAVCIHRSHRITGRHVVDIGSGAGLQSIFLQRDGENSVTGIEIDHTRYMLSRLNALEMGVKGIRFISGDFHSLNVRRIAHEDSVIFSDPLRSGTSGNMNFQNLRPDPSLVVETFSPVSRDYCFDLPPHMPVENIFIQGEREYISTDGQLSRLTLYTGKLALNEVSALILPSGKLYSGTPEDFECRESYPEDYIYVADQAVSNSGLIPQVIKGSGIHCIYRDHRRVILSSSNYKPDFPGEIHKVLTETREDRMREDLARMDAIKAIPRFHIKPDDYYQFRNLIEFGLRGHRNIYIFNLNNSFFLTEKIDSL